jgi:hypothetical protein
MARSPARQHCRLNTSPHCNIRKKPGLISRAFSWAIFKRIYGSSLRSLGMSKIETLANILLGPLLLMVRTPVGSRQSFRKPRASAKAWWAPAKTFVC